MPSIKRPTFPPGYVDNPRDFVEWDIVEQCFREAKNYWVCSVSPKSHPHVIPKWGVWVRGKLYYDGSSETRHARNLVLNPQVAIHLESGDEAMILYGTAREILSPERILAEQIAAEYVRKYEKFGYAPSEDQWDQGGLTEILPKQVIAWTNFMENPTKFVFDELSEQ